MMKLFIGFVDAADVIAHSRDVRHVFAPTVGKKNPLGDIFLQVRTKTSLRFHNTTAPSSGRAPAA